MVLTSMFLGLFSDIVSLSSLLVAYLKLSALKSLRAALTSVFSVRAIVCEGVAVFEKNWHPFRSEISLDLIVLLPSQNPSQLQLLTRCSFKEAGFENMRKRGGELEEGKGHSKERYM